MNVTPGMLSSKPKKRKRVAEPAEASFAPGALSRAEEEAGAFAGASPFPHVHLSSIFASAALLEVQRELGLLSSTFKETDLFKVYQTGDLANLDAANAEHAAALPATIALRASLYSPSPTLLGGSDVIFEIAYSTAGATITLAVGTALSGAQYSAPPGRQHAFVLAALGDAGEYTTRVVDE